MAFHEIRNMQRTHEASRTVPLSARLAIALGFAVLLGACSMSPSMCDTFGPEKSATVAVPQNASVEAVFACIDQASAASNDSGSPYDTGYAIRDTRSGVLESQHYSTPNTAGFRLRAEMSKKTSTLKLSLRGAGAYCADLGVDKEMSRLTSAIGSCLQR